MNSQYRNQHTIRSYNSYLENSVGLDPKTINVKISAINVYENFTSHEDFLKFDKNRAIRYKESLLKYDERGVCSAPTTVIEKLRSVRDFFKWLQNEAGYKRIPKNDIDYFNLNNKMKQQILSEPDNSYPTKEHTLRLIESISNETEVDMRDAALISLAYSSGMRISALRTLSLGQIDITKMIVKQSPHKGMETKNAKSITTPIFDLDPLLTEIICDWVTYLKEQKGFSDRSPYVPQCKFYKSPGSLINSKSVDVLDVFYKSKTPLEEIFSLRAEEAGLPNFSPHSFRRGCIMELIDHVENAKQFAAVSKVMGHESLKTTVLSYSRMNNDYAVAITKDIDLNKGGKIGNWRGY